MATYVTIARTTRRRVRLDRTSIATVAEGGTQVDVDDPAIKRDLMRQVGLWVAIADATAPRTFKFTYDFDEHGGAVGAITLDANDGQLPNNFVVEKCVWHTVTPAASGGAATIAVGVTGNTDGFIAATAFTDNKFDTADQVTTAAGDQISVITSAASDVVFTVAAAALTAGKINFWVSGYQSE
jgi:hypothetical protein